MKFDTAQEMLDYIQDDNECHDLYSEKAEIYVFLYNDAGSIATYDINKIEAKELAKKVKYDKYGEEYWGAFLGPGGKIWDDVSHECYQEGNVSNLEMCEELIEYDDWILTDNYLDYLAKKKKGKTCK